MDQNILRTDASMAKALIWLGGDDIRWCRVLVLSGPNEHGQYHVRRLRNNWEGVTTAIRNLTDNDREYIRNNYL